jgi:hypothetical protein
MAEPWDDAETMFSFEVRNKNIRELEMQIRG